MDQKRSKGVGRTAARTGESPPLPASGKPRASDLTLHQLRIFWAVARSNTLTSAAKQLGLTQPSLSQQLAKLEANVGTLLFHRRSSEMELTEAGNYLLPRVEHILRSISELEDGLGEFQAGKRLTVRLAGINSVLRVLVPDAIAAMQQRFPELDFDLIESDPTEVLDLLYGRRVNVGLLAANSVAQAGVGFVQVPLLEDPYVLAVPHALVLDGITDPRRELSPEQWTLLNSTIQFAFGSQHTNQVLDWYERLLPEHRLVAHCRSFETAIGLVRAGTGICLAPALATVGLSGAREGVRLYRISEPARRLVALVPSQYRRVEPYATLLDVLQTRASTYAVPEIHPEPAWLASRSRLSED